MVGLRARMGAAGATPEVPWTGPPDYVGNGGGIDNPSGTTHSIQLPAANTGDLLLATYEFQNAVDVISTPADWYVVSALKGTNQASLIMGKPKAPGDVAPPVVVSASTTSRAICYRIEGAKKTPWNGVGTPEWLNAGAHAVDTTSYTAPGVITTDDNTLLLVVWASDGSTGTADFTPPAGMTKESRSIGSSPFCVIVLASEVRPTAGATGTRTATASGISNSRSKITMAIKSNEN